MTSRPPPLVPKAESSSSNSTSDDEKDPMNWKDFDLFVYFSEQRNRMFESLFQRMVGTETMMHATSLTRCTNIFKALQEAQKIYDDPYDGKTPNPYHNALHGADVLWSTSHLIRALRTELKVSLKLIDNPDIIFDISIAALFHDYRHLGVNNDFLKRSRHELAMRYCDRAVLEHHHASEALRLLDRTDVTKSMSFERRSQFRKRVSSFILATDFARQNRGIEEVEGFFGKYLKACRSNDSEPKSYLPSFHESGLESVLNLVIECSDVGHPTKSSKIHMRWALLVQEEFFLQGKLQEKANINDPIGLFTESKMKGNESKMEGTESKMKGNQSKMKGNSLNMEGH